MSAGPKSSFASDLIRLAIEPDFTLGDLEVRPSTREAIRDGRRTVVEPRIMQVLVALARAHGAVVSRDELIRRCWDGRVVGEAAINRCIFKLRELAGTGEGRTSFQIETIARVGYRLEAETGIGSATVPSSDMLLPASRVTRRRRALPWIAAGVAAVAVAIAGTFVWYRANSESAADAMSIAVLPLKDLSPGADAGYLAAGIQDEILTRLAKIGSLKVISRTSAVEVAKRPGTLKDVARQLGVANVLEGSVQRSGDTVRVNVQLIRVASDDHLWAEDYDRKLGDVLALENDIAGAIAASLPTKLTPSESAALTPAARIDPKAYDFYLRALVRFHEWNDGERDAQALLEQSVAADPSFAPAWAMLSRMDGLIYFGRRDAEHRDAALGALDRAKALRPDLAEVQLADAQYKHYVDLDLDGARHELEALHAKWPGNVEILQSLAFLARRVGHYTASIGYLRDAENLDPLSRPNYDALVFTLQFVHRHEEAIEVANRMLEIWPDASDILICKAELLQEAGDLAGAAATLDRIPPSVEISPDVLWTRRAQFAYERRFADGLRYFEALRPAAASWDPLRRGYFALSIGEFQSWTGDRDSAHANFRAAADAAEEILKDNPVDADGFIVSAVAWANFGDRDATMRSLERYDATALSNDPVNGEAVKECHAYALARLGDRDGAIAALTSVVDGPGNITPAMLRLEPVFDSLRRDPRFERLLGEQPPIKDE